MLLRWLVGHEYSSLCQGPESKHFGSEWASTLGLDIMGRSYTERQVPIHMRAFKLDVYFPQETKLTAGIMYAF